MVPLPNDRINPASPDGVNELFMDHLPASSKGTTSDEQPFASKVEKLQSHLQLAYQEIHATKASMQKLSLLCTSYKAERDHLLLTLRKAAELKSAVATKVVFGQPEASLSKVQQDQFREGIEAASIASDHNTTAHKNAPANPKKRTSDQKKIRRRSNSEETATKRKRGNKAVGSPAFGQPSIDNTPSLRDSKPRSTSLPFGTISISQQVFEVEPSASNAQPTAEPLLPPVTVEEPWQRLDASLQEAAFAPQFHEAPAVCSFSEQRSSMLRSDWSPAPQPYPWPSLDLSTQRCLPQPENGSSEFDQGVLQSMQQIPAHLSFLPPTSEIWQESVDCSSISQGIKGMTKARAPNGAPYPDFVSDQNIDKSVRTPDFIAAPW